MVVETQGDRIVSDLALKVQLLAQTQLGEYLTLKESYKAVDFDTKLKYINPTNYVHLKMFV